MRTLITLVLLSGCALVLLSGCGDEPEPTLVQCGGPVLTDVERDRWANLSWIVSMAASLQVRIDLVSANKCHEPCAEVMDEAQEYEPECRIDESRISSEMRQWYGGSCYPIAWNGRVGCCIAGVRQISVNGTPAPGVAFLECE